ncbi:histone deacetylase family protein [Thalassotalea ganghwensis]
MTVGVFSHPKCSAHDMGNHHPESPIRLAAIQDQLIRSGLEFVVQQFDATPIEPSLLTLAHCPNYIDSIIKNAPNEGTYKIDDDTVMMPATLSAALYSAGAAINAVDKVMLGELTSAFCATRPPGHHAEYDKGMGFCIFNNVAIAAAYVKQKYQLDRVAIIDFDVHHGNGTENIIKDKSGYLFCSSYQDPFYPFNVNANFTPPIINTPLNATAKGEEFREAVSQYWLPALAEFQPEFIFISAGFDAHLEDEMSSVSLVESDYRWVTDQIKVIADSFAKGRMVSVLEGGYAPSALGRSVVEHLKGLIG